MDTPEIWYTEAVVSLQVGEDYEALRDELIAKATKTAEDAFKVQPGGCGLMQFLSYAYDQSKHRVLISFSFTQDGEISGVAESKPYTATDVGMTGIGR